MKKVRVILFAIAFLMSITGFAVYGTMTGAPVSDCQETASGCRPRCGDGICARRCGENENVCPRDCLTSRTR